MKRSLFFRSPIVTAQDAEGAGEGNELITLPPNDLPRNAQGSGPLSGLLWRGDFFVCDRAAGSDYALGTRGVYTFGPTFARKTLIHLGI